MEMCDAVGRAHEFFLVLKKAGFTDDLIKKIINSKDNVLAKRMFAAIVAPKTKTTKNTEAALLAEAAKLELRDGEFVLIVNYARTLDEMIAAGNYDDKNGDINADHFPLPVELNGQAIEVKAKLFHFNRLINRKNAIAEMDKAGYRPATIAELLALGEAQPELQKQFPILALASVWQDGDGDRSVAYLCADGGRRELELSWFGNVLGGLGDFSGGCRFLAVRKELSVA
ncbi:MAG: hypothetical protein NTX66_03030 [Candidatus Falkowbacteria bacterium]|nr:hypothetical protein [Candidatus Falkowbacteria bacterium]